MPRPKGSAWMELHRRFVERGKNEMIAKEGPVDLLFLGDSITQGWNNNDVWQRFYEPRHAANFGIGGDRTQHVLWRIQNGELDGIEPKVVVLMIGTNNDCSASPDESPQGITSIVLELRQRLPKTRVLLLGVFPRDQRPGPLRERLKSINDKIAKLDDGSNVRFLNIEKAFLNDDGTISRKIMPDYLHLSHRGLSQLGRRHGTDALVDARRAQMISTRSSRRIETADVTTRTGPRASASADLPHMACWSENG